MHRHAPIGTAIIHLFGEIVKSFHENRHNIRKRQVKSVNYVDRIRQQISVFYQFSAVGNFCARGFSTICGYIIYMAQGGRICGGFLLAEMGLFVLDRRDYDGRKIMRKTFLFPTRSAVAFLPYPAIQISH
jgi:hypothetical protein